jgi:hypothetical protein
MHSLYRLIYLVYLIASCSCAAGWDDPPKPLPGQPCSELEVECVTQHGCCPKDVTTCGGEPNSVGCPAGACCAIGPGFMASREDAGLPPGARPMRMVKPSSP